MGAKNNDETLKYNLMCKIVVEGANVNESDIVGALFGQTEGLLESDMDLKQLQKSGRIGRIKLDLKIDKERTVGSLTIPSSMSKVETAIIAATLESVDRVGPCACTISLDKVVDVRKEKRDSIAKRASEIMKKWEVETYDEIKDLHAKVEKDAKKGQIQRYGPDKLPAGPSIYQSKEVILVEGRADVLTLMKMDINNTVATQGHKIPATIKALAKKSQITALLDGDRGGDMILKEIALFGKIEYIARAPLKREVENLGYEEVTKALDERVPLEEAVFMTEDLTVAEFLKDGGHFDPKVISGRKSSKSSKSNGHSSRFKKGERKTSSKRERDTSKSEKPGRSSRKSSDRKSREPRGRRREPRIQLSKALEKIVDATKRTFNAVFVGKSDETLITVSSSEAYDKLKETDGVETVIIDGVITQRLLDLAHEKSIKLLAGAVIGDISNKSDNVKFTTFSKL